MKFQEYGLKHKDAVILLHGGGLSWWNYREVALLLQGEYHVILPILDGHAGSDHPFTTIEENASEIIEFIEFCLKCCHNAKIFAPMLWLRVHLSFRQN